MKQLPSRDLRDSKKKLFFTIEELQEDFKKELIEQIKESMLELAITNIAKNRYYEGLNIDLTIEDFNEYYPDYIKDLTRYISKSIKDFDKYYQLVFRHNLGNEKNGLYIEKLEK